MKTSFIDELIKLAFDVLDESGATWTRRGKKHIQSTLDVLEKKHGKKAKFTYFVSQNEKDYGGAKETDFANQPKATTTEIRKQVFKKWDKSKGSFGHILVSKPKKKKRKKFLRII